MAAVQRKPTQEQDRLISNPPPTDGISCLAANGSSSALSTMLIAGSWDNNLHVYELQYQAGTAQIIGSVKHNPLGHEAPVLCADIADDGYTTFSAGCDGSVRMWDVRTAATAATVLGRHDQPVRNLRYVPEQRLVFTSSWDKTIRIWDPRTSQPVGGLQLPERVYAMDAKVVGGAFWTVAVTADNNVHVYQSQAPGAPAKVAEYKSPLTYQTRCVSIFEANAERRVGPGFAQGCIEGRVAIEYFEEGNLRMQMQQNPAAKSSTKLNSFVFKCHRDAQNIYGVNAVDFNNRNTFLTAGSDGVICTWDKDERHRLAEFGLHKGRCPISAAKFSPMGNQMFYAVSYDWSKGHEHANPQLGNSIYFHNMEDSETRPKEKARR